MATISQLISYNKAHNCALRRRKKKHLSKSPHLDSCPFKRGVCLKILTQKPRKPNSAIRRIARIRILRTGKILIAYIPGRSHNLAQHSVVLIRGMGAKDLPGVNYKLLRNKLDFVGSEAGFERTKRRSKYGLKKIK